MRVHRVRTSLLVAALCAALLGCPSDLLEEVRALHAQDRHLESLAMLEALIEERPDDPEVHYLYGLASVQAGRASVGLWSLRRASEFEGWEVRAGVELARAGLYSRDDRATIEAASRVLDLEPDQRPALDFRAEALARNGDFETALADVTRLRELTPDDGDVELLGLRVLIGLRRLDDADALFASIEERLASGALELPAERHCAAKATFAAERGEMDLARQTFDACLEAHPVDPLVLESALEFFDKTQDFARSQEILERTLEKQPEAAQLRKHLASRLRKQNRMEEAEALLLEGTELEPALVAAYSWGTLAGHYFELGDFGAAVSAWSHYMELVPKPGDEARFAYAEALTLAGEHERALALAEDLPDIHSHLIRGRVLLEQRRPREALEALSAGVRLWPDNPVARYYTALAAEHTGDFDRAISEYRDAVRADPGATTAGYRLGRLHFAEGRYEEARFALHHHVGAHPTDTEAWALFHRVNLRLGQQPLARQALQRLSRLPDERGRSVAEAANSLAATQGDGAAADFLLQQPGGLDLMHDSNAAGLRSLVAHLGRAGRPEVAITWAKSALDAWPDEAVLHELYAVALEQDGRPRSEVEASHSRALELDPEHALSQRAMARLAADAGDLAAALEAYERALSSVARGSLEEAEVGVESATLLLSSGRDAQAMQLLEDLLWRHPYDSQVVALLAERLRAESPTSDRALELTRRATRFRSLPEPPPEAAGG